MHVHTEFRLHVEFIDGSTGEVDLKEFLASDKIEGSVFEPLRDPSLFGQAYVELGAVTWPNGTDLAPDAMHEEIRRHGRWVVPAD